jgi:hypothetical protein
MRLLWEESALGVIGAFCVAAFALGTAWIVLEGVVDLNGIMAGLLAIATAGATLEAISRRHYGLDRPRAPGARSARSAIPAAHQSPPRQRPREAPSQASGRRAA